MKQSRHPGQAAGVFLLACFLLVQSPSARAITDEVRSMCQQAEQLINSGKANDAIKLLNRAQQMDPSCGEVHGYMGMAYQNTGRPQQAVGEYQKALQLNPQMSFINVNLGTCYMNMNQIDMAVPYLQRYLQENPNAPDARQVQSYLQQAGARKGQNQLRGKVEEGQALINQHRYPEACAAFEQAISQQPNFAPAHFYYGFALAQSGQPQRAIGEFQTCLKLDPSMSEAVLNIGSNYQSLGDSANAISWYQRFLQQNPRSPKASDIKQRIDGLRQQMSQQQSNPNPPQAQMPMAGGMPPTQPNDYFASVANNGHYFRWPRMPIRVCIVSGAGVPGYQNVYYQILLDSFSQWAVGSQNRLSFALVNNPQEADIYCDWTADPNQIIRQGQAVEGGITSLNGQPMPNGVDVALTNVRMTILTNRGGTPLNGDDMKKVCLHEVGHALGLNGHSNNNTDVMFFSESPTVWPALTDRDKATICRLYANYPMQNPGQ